MEGVNDAWVLGLWRACSRREKSALNIIGGDSSYWPTPTASSTGDWPEIDFSARPRELQDAAPDQPDRPRHGGDHLVDDVGDDARHGRQDHATAGRGELPLFAPGPGDLAAWQRWLDADATPQPAFLGMDHGLADWLDRHRQCGNGVVPLQAAHAITALASELYKTALKGD